MRVHRTGKPSDLPELKRVWSLAFGDPEDEVERYFGDFLQVENTCLTEEDGKILAEISFAPTELCFADGTSRSACYWYAMGVDPALQGQGIGIELMHRLPDILRSKGIRTGTLMPANAPLFYFYGLAGYRTAFYVEEIIAGPCPEGEVSTVTAEEYAALRETLLIGRDHLAEPLPLLRRQAELGGIFYRITLSGQTGCAVYWEDDEGSAPPVRELLTPAGYEERMLSALAASAGKTLTARIPVRAGHKGIPFGVIDWLGEEPVEMHDAWIGLTLD